MAESPRTTKPETWATSAEGHLFYEMNTEFFRRKVKVERLHNKGTLTGTEARILRSMYDLLEDMAFGYLNTRVKKRLTKAEAALIKGGAK